MIEGGLEALELHPVAIPMRHRFRRVDSREAVLIKGPRGWGEFSPFPEYPPEVTTRWLAAALELACAELPSPGRSRVAVNVTIPAVEPEVARALALESGARTAKVKIANPGDTESDDIARIEAVKTALGPDALIRIDVNASWSLETAAERLKVLQQFELDYVEQPVATAEEMRRLKDEVGIRVAADELVRNNPHPLAVIDEGNPDVLILKVQPMGGVARVLDLASRSTVPVVISSALETSVGIYGGILAASLLGDDELAHGLGTVSLNEGDPTLDPLIPIDGYIEVRRPEPSPELLQRWRPDRDVSAELLRRVRAAAEVLT